MKNSFEIPTTKAAASQEARRFIESLPPDFAQAQLDALDEAVAGNSAKLDAVREGRKTPTDVRDDLYMLEIRKKFGGTDSKIRVYLPKNPEGDMPIVVYYHGGGWCINSVESCARICQDIAEKNNAIVVSPDYRLAPEHPFPAANSDATETLDWTIANAEKFGGNPRRIFTAGDSAGGHLAAVAALARPKTVRGAILIYPALDLTAKRRPSRSLFAKGFCLNGDLMDKFTAAYIPSEEQRATPEASPILADKSKFPDALIISSQCDILRDEAEEFARSLDAAKRNVRYVCVEGATHLFITQKGMDKAYARALAEISEFVESAQ